MSEQDSTQAVSPAIDEVPTQETTTVSSTAAAATEQPTIAKEVEVPHVEAGAKPVPVIPIINEPANEKALPTDASSDRSPSSNSSTAVESTTQPLSSVQKEKEPEKPAAPETEKPASKHPNSSAVIPPPPAANVKEPARVPAQGTKKKRKGWSIFALFASCFGGAALEDNEKKTKASSGSASKTDQQPLVGEKAFDAGNSTEGTDSSHPTSSTLVEEKDLKDEVVVAPSTPVSPPIDETGGLTSSAVVPPGSGSTLHAPPTPTKVSADSSSADAPEDYATDSDGEHEGDKDDKNGYEGEEMDEEEEEEISLLGGMGIPIGPDGQPQPLLPPLAPEHLGRKCLVLDLDETLLHSSFKMIPSADYIVPVEIESQVHNVYVIKRPGVDNFLKQMGEIYEVVIFTASLSKYADPVLDMLDVHRVVSHRLFRESCYNHKGNYVKDLSQLGRPIDECIILDNSPASYIFHPNNAVPVSTWFNDPHDTELTDLCPFLADLETVDDVRGVLDGAMLL